MFSLYYLIIIILCIMHINRLPHITPIYQLLRTVLVFIFITKINLTCILCLHHFYPSTLKDIVVAWVGGRASGRADKPREHSHVRNFLRIIFKFSKNIYCPQISDEFDHGGSASLNMSKMNHFISLPLLAFLDWFVRLKSPNLVQI